MLKFLDKALKEKKWDYKKDLYLSEFQSIENVNPITKPDLSIVIISWRLHRDTIINFQEIEKQRFCNCFELIFVNNGGADEEFETLKPYINTYIKLKNNTGAYKARNIGAIFSNAPLILFLEDDGIPDEDLISSHIMVHEKYNPHAVVGVYLYKTENPLNDRQMHYYQGNEFYPRYSLLEGNSSYLSDVFFSVGGWDDEIYFGWGGKELAIRLLKYSGDFTKQIYSPISIIYHDYANSYQHLKDKIEKQRKSFSRLEQKYSEWLSFGEKWAPFWGREEMLPQSSLWEKNENLQMEFENLTSRIKERNTLRLKKYMRGKIFLYDTPAFLKVVTSNKSGQYAIFGAGEYGRTVLKRLRDLNINTSYFIDNNSMVWGTEIEGVRIISPQDISSDMFVFVASAWYYEIRKQLIEMKLIEDDHFKIVIK